MLYCKKCKVSVIGDKHCCPLCHETVTGLADAESDVFPILKKPKYTKHFLLRLVSFIAISTIVISYALNIMIPTTDEVMWSFFVAGGTVCAWISIAVVITSKRNIFKNINWQLFLITVFAVAWDYFTGWNRWSIDYVIPFSCVASIVCMYVISKVLKVDARGLGIYLIFDAVYGIIPIIFILTDSLNVLYPSMACVVCSIISASAILLFKGRYIIDELQRKFHV